jgi:WD40 repeat protein
VVYAGWRVFIWNATTGNLENNDPSQPFEGRPDNPINAVAWSGDGTTIATGAMAGYINLWDAVTRQRMTQLSGHNGEVRSLKWSADSTKLASGGSDGYVKVWSVDGQLLHDIPVLMDINEVDWSPTGNEIAVATANGLSIWDIASGQQIGSVPDLDYAVTVDWSPTGAQIAYGGVERATRTSAAHIIDVPLPPPSPSLAAPGGCYNLEQNRLHDEE